MTKKNQRIHFAFHIRRTEVEVFGGKNFDLVDVIYSKSKGTFGTDLNMKTDGGEHIDSPFWDLGRHEDTPEEDVKVQQRYAERIRILLEGGKFTAIRGGEGQYSVEVELIKA